MMLITRIIKIPSSVKTLLGQAPIPGRIRLLRLQVIGTVFPQLLSWRRYFWTKLETHLMLECQTLDEGRIFNILNLYGTSFFSIMEKLG
ncbi:hypothetical protein AM500_06820 [Bacillus sp. FJAT-18017]|nr:hypothetical protein AM500_06820 [Bacillus sp. FJAT-18017]